MAVGCSTSNHLESNRLEASCRQSPDGVPCLTSFIANMPDVISYTTGKQADPFMGSEGMWRASPVDPDTLGLTPNWQPVADVILGVRNPTSESALRRDFEIRVPRNACVPGNGTIAFLGEAQDGSISLLTNSGPVDVDEPDLRIGLDVRVIVDRETETILATLIGPMDFAQRFAFAFIGGQKVAMAYEDQCFNALRRGKLQSLTLLDEASCGPLLPQMRDAAARSAKRPSGGTLGVDDFGLSEADEADIAIARRALTTRGYASNHVFSSAVTNDRKHIVVNIHEPCT